MRLDVLTRLFPRIKLAPAPRFEKHADRLTIGGIEVARINLLDTCTKRCKIENKL
jgi:hypothetical protein